MALQCVDILLDYMDQRGLKYNGITDTRKIHIIVKRSLNSSQKQETMTNNFSK